MKPLFSWNFTRLLLQTRAARLSWCRTPRLLCFVAMTASLTVALPVIAQQPEPEPELAPAAVEAPAATTGDELTTGEAPTEPAATTPETVPTPDAAQTAPKEDVPPPYGSRDERDRTLLARALPNEAQWLDGEQGKVFALYRPTESRQTKGALALFHAIDDPQRWPVTLRSLQDRLPKSGWEILAVALPRQRLQMIPAREASASAEATSSASASADEPPDNTAPALVDSYLKAATQFLRDKSHDSIIVMADNASALNTMAFFHTDPQARETLEGLILIHLQSQQPLDIAELEQLFSDKDLPVFEVFFGRDADVAERRERHKGVALRQKVVTYHQLTIDEADPVLRAQGRNFFMGRIQGFMDRHRAPLPQQDNKR